MQRSPEWLLLRVLICSTMRQLILCVENAPRLSASETAFFPACPCGDSAMIFSRPRTMEVFSRIIGIAYHSDVV